MEPRLLLTLFLCLVVRGWLDDPAQHSAVAESVHPREIHLKLAKTPQTFAPKKSKGFLFTTEHPESKERPPCGECVFRVVCKGSKCAKACKYCEKHPETGVKVNFDFDSVSGSDSDEEDHDYWEKEHKPTGGPRHHEAVTKSSKPSKTEHRQTLKDSDETVTKSNALTKTEHKPTAAPKQHETVTVVDKHMGPFRKWIHSRREFRKKKMEERNEPKHETTVKPADAKKTHESENSKLKHDKTTPTDKMTTATTMKEKEAPLDKTNVFSVAKKEEMKHEKSNTIVKDDKKSSENKSLEKLNIIKLLDKVVKDKDRHESDKHEVDKDKNKEHDTKVSNKIEKHIEKHTKEHDNNSKANEVDEIEWDPVLQTKIDEEVKHDTWPYVIGKLLQTEIESAHYMLTNKPVKKVLKNIKDRFKPIFISVSKALAEVFATDAAQAEKSLQSLPATTVAPPAPTKLTSKATHLSKGAAVKANADRRRIRHRQRTRPGVAAQGNKLNELESHGAKSGEVVKNEELHPVTWCSCKRVRPRRIDAPRARGHRLRAHRHLDGA